MDRDNRLPRRQSRLHREMKADGLNSPTSSTGSHDTVSTTTQELSQNLSTFSFSPDGEGTPKHVKDFRPAASRRAPADRAAKFAALNDIINTSALGRAFPEWTGLASLTNTSSKQLDNALAARAAAPFAEEAKENIPPVRDYTSAENDTFDIKNKKVRTEMQARVENESDCSTVLSQTPARTMPSSRRTRHAKTPLADLSSSPPRTSRPSLQGMINKVRMSQSLKDKPVATEASSKQALATDNFLEADFSINPAINQSGVSHTVQSFFLPNIRRHLRDWTSGTLQFSTMKNGVPVFVKNGKAHSRLGQSSNEHAEVDALQLPEEEERIFISMDKLREEVRELQDHDDMMIREAEKLQQEVIQLQAELQRFKSRKPSDSAFGSGSDSDKPEQQSLRARGRLEQQVAELQSRLEELTRQVGVNDVHTAALSAERDEALHQASTARDRIAKLQSELQSTQKDLTSAIHHRHETETLQLENTSLRAMNETIRTQLDTVTEHNKIIVARYDQVQRDFKAIQQTLASVRKELDALREDNRALQEEQAVLAQDHSGLERNNDWYFSENKLYKERIAVQEERIADLKKTVAAKDEMIDELQNMTGYTAEAQDRRLELHIEDLKAQIRQRDATIADKNREIIQLKATVETLRSHNKELAVELQHSEDGRQAKTQAILGVMHDNVTDFNRQQADMSQRLDRRTAAIRKAKQLTKEITNLSSTNIVAKPAKVTRIVDPQPRPPSSAGNTVTRDLTAKSSVLNVDDDPTQQIDFTGGSDFASVFTDDEIPMLKARVRELRQERQQQRVQHDDQTVESELTSQPVITAARAASLSKGQPAGILKKSSQVFTQVEDAPTGRFSVKSDISIGNTYQSHRSAKSISSMQARPTSRSHHRRLSDSGPVLPEPTITMEQNMTSAFFVPDITLQSEKQKTAEAGPALEQEGAGPALSKTARRIMKGLCQHNARDCRLCYRVSSHNATAQTSTHHQTNIAYTSAGASATSRVGKKTIRVTKPTAVSDRMPAPRTVITATEEYEEEPTMRPSMAPGNALAIAIAQIKDEIDYVKEQIANKQAAYNALDESLGRRERKAIMAELQGLQKEAERKSDQLYLLYDVLEGQKAAGQEMSEEELEVTIRSIVSVEHAGGREGEEGTGTFQGFE